jgi:nuclear-control-of-ATPase protein 2
MTLSLAKDKLKYGTQQLQALSEKIRVGDLTPVLEIYEKDIESPLKSAIAGTLVRSIFIQVQKAKVFKDTIVFMTLLHNVDSRSTLIKP